MNRYLELLLGVILIALGIYGIAAYWWDELYMLIKGCVALFLLGGGAVLFIAGILSSDE